MQLDLVFQHFLSSLLTFVKTAFISFYNRSNDIRDRNNLKRGSYYGNGIKIQNSVNKWKILEDPFSI